MTKKHNYEVREMMIELSRDESRVEDSAQMGAIVTLCMAGSLFLLGVPFR